MKNKVVVISLHKTGTSSLALFLENLGYKVTGPDTHLFVDAVAQQFETIDEFLKNYDAFQDDPWYLLYPYIKEQYPKTKFIYLKRDESNWINSVQAFYGEDKYNNAVRRKFYGHANTFSHQQHYLEKYRSHQKAVFAFFKEDPNFISLEINNPKDAVLLQKFLGLTVKFNSFPHVNKTPRTIAERRSRKVAQFFKGYFGLNNIVKKALRSVLGYQRFIKTRDKIRLYRTRMRLFRKKLIGR